MAPGRPRDPEVDAAARHAAIGLIVEDGYRALSMDRIAERAGVSKAALYRRWPNKVALAADAINEYAATTTAAPDTGSASGDIVEVLTAFLRKRRREAETFEALLAAVSGSPELAARCRGPVVANLKAVFRTIVERGVARGELPGDTDSELLADVAPALLRYRRQTTGLRNDTEYIQRIADQFFGMRRQTDRYASAEGAGAGIAS